MSGPVRAATLLNRLLGLEGVAAVDPESWQVEPGGGEIVVRVRLARRRLVCPECSYATAHRYDTRTWTPRGGIWIWMVGCAGSECVGDGCGARDHREEI
jgi:hypothetical protein